MVTHKFRMAPVQRTPYHRVVLSYQVDERGAVWVNKIIPEVGAVPMLQHVDQGPHESLADARKAVRKAMCDKATLCLDFIRLTPKNWIQFVLGLDDWLYKLDLSFDDLDLDDLDVKLKVKCKFPDSSQERRIDSLYGTLTVGDEEFDYEFGVIDWEKFSLV